MSVPRLRLRLLVAAAGIIGTALLIRVATAGGSIGSGRVEQYSGTALYASLVHVAVLFLRPRWSPWAAGAVALAWCWGVECLQLTGVPADLSARSLPARLVLGAAFDPVDLFWYPVGIAPLVGVHAWLRHRSGRAGRG